MNKAVDIIIPTYRPDEKVVFLVKKLLKQTYQADRIHLINTETGVFPSELEVLDSRVKITHIRKEEFDHGGTRHMGAMQSKADFVVFMTQDALPANDRMLEELMRPFEDPQVAASYGRQLPASDCNLIERYTREFNYPAESRVKSLKDLETLGIKTYFCSDVCAAYRKTVYDSLGGFEEKTIFNEDMIMAARMIHSGARVAYAAEAKVIHSHNYSCMQQLKRNFDLAVSQAEHPDIFENVRSESEGIRLVKDTAAYLVKKKKPWMVISLVVKSGFKYIGYRLGKNYRKLPEWLIRKCTMNPGYWE
ncbi:MAG: glycosyltransferase family 2 protein [Schaedlerella sp.]|nr:glycosyltransferase family 2 protein [Lachnospiraceae bacterium]MDY4202673.1 glycosyltransferase family 2 protein [Schaedlerella sp.]